MKNRLDRLESEVERLSDALARIEERLDALEASPPEAVPRRTTVSRAAPAEVEAAGPSDSEIARAVTLLGRTFLILGGGYLLRALAESGAMDPMAAAGLGLLYGIGWLLMADRAGAKANTLSAAFHGGAAILVAFPLLWEVTTRFELLAPAVAASCLGLVSAVAITVAWRWRLRSFAWITVVGATVTSLALIVGTRALAPFSLLLVLIGVATLWLSYHANWPVVHWIVAGIADLSVVLLTMGIVIERSDVPVAAAVAIQLTLFLAFVGSFAVRLLKQSEEPGRFEPVQAGAVVLLGYGGALWIAPEAVARMLGVLGFALGIASYRVSLSSRMASRSTSALFGGLGLATLLLGSLAILPEPTPLLAAVAVTLAWFGARYEKPVLSLHASVAVAAASISSGLLASAGYAFLAPAGYAWPPVSVWIFAAAAAAAAGYGLRSRGEPDRWFVRWRLAGLMDLGILVWALGGLVLAGLAPAIAGLSGDGGRPGALATLRTGVLAGSALLLGWMGRKERFREARWLVYPVLLAGGIKLAIEDFPEGRAVTLFLSLALYGGALIAAPRIARD